jgi:hypothetical protein
MMKPVREGVLMALMLFCLLETGEAKEGAEPAEPGKDDDKKKGTEQQIIWDDEVGGYCY